LARSTEDPWIIARERNNANFDIKLTYEIYDVDEAPTIQLSNSTILNGSAAYTRIGQITANDVIRLYRYGKFLGITITCWITNMNLNRITAFYCHINLVLNY
jgi:hypothetical protein